MAQQQATYTEGVTTKANIRAAINANATDAESRLVALELPVVAITDEAVAMTANRRYVGSIAGFTADRSYTLPEGVAGQVIEVQLTSGDDAYELILLGTSGVSINGGVAATEWSRLFISGEFVRFRCIATNDWRVEIDARKFETVQRIGTSTSAFANSTWTKLPLNLESGDSGFSGTNEIVVRRAGMFIAYAFNRFQPSGGTQRLLNLSVGTPGESNINNLTSIATFTEITSEANKRVQVIAISFLASAGQAISAWYYTDGVLGTNQFNVNEPVLNIRRVA
jgi:hypothetical protein